MERDRIDRNSAYYLLHRRVWLDAYDHARANNVRYAEDLIEFLIENYTAPHRIVDTDVRGSTGPSGSGDS